MSDLDLDALDAIRSTHRRSAIQRGIYVGGELRPIAVCEMCGGEWPCTSLALADEVERLRAENARLREQKIAAVEIAQELLRKVVP